MYQDSSTAALVSTRRSSPLRSISYNSTRAPVIPPKSGMRKQLQHRFQRRQTHSNDTPTLNSLQLSDGAAMTHVGHMIQDKKLAYNGDSRRPKHLEMRRNRELQTLGSDDTCQDASNALGLPCYQCTTPVTTNTCNDPPSSASKKRRPEARPSRASQDSAYFSADSSPCSSPRESVIRKPVLPRKAQSRYSSDSAYHSASEASSSHSSPITPTIRLVPSSFSDDSDNDSELPAWHISSAASSPKFYHLPPWSRLDLLQNTARSPSPTSQYGRETPPPDYSVFPSTTHIDDLLFSAEHLAEQYRDLLSSRNSTRPPPRNHLRVQTFERRGPTPPPKETPSPPQPHPKELRHLILTPSQIKLRQGQIEAESGEKVVSAKTFETVRNEFGNWSFRSSSAVPERVARMKKLRRKTGSGMLKSWDGSGSCGVLREEVEG